MLTSVCVCVCVRARVYVHVCVSVCVHVHVCVCVCMCMWMFVYVCMCDLAWVTKAHMHMYKIAHLRTLFFLSHPTYVYVSYALFISYTVKCPLFSVATSSESVIGMRWEGGINWDCMKIYGK